MDSNASEGTILPAVAAQGTTRIHEFGARVDGDCRKDVDAQIRQARALYNNIVAVIRDIHQAMTAYVLEHAGPEATALKTHLGALNDAFDKAREANDEARMKEVAQARREVWPQLNAALKATRLAHRREIQERFLARIGRTTKCDTYALRCKAVDDGLGWATANQVLDAALQAFQASMRRGMAPRFARADDKVQDTLTLQFTKAGGVPVEDLLAGRHTEFRTQASSGRRKYSGFEFRLGPAKAGTYATGTWQYHRAIHEGSTVGMVRLVRRRVGKDTKWALQFMVNSDADEGIDTTARKPLAAIHFGWSGDLAGRRVAGITDGADPGLARILRLPESIEQDMERAADIQSNRDQRRDKMVAFIKAHPWADIGLLDAGPSDECERGSTPWLYARVAEELHAIKRLQPQHVALTRLHRLCRMLSDLEVAPAEFEAWRKQDRLAWQAAAHLARGARNARKNFYRVTANTLAADYSALLIEPLDLKTAALKVDEVTGKRTEFARKARAGRVVAAVYEFESAIRAAAGKHRTVLLELTGATTVMRCAHCSGNVSPNSEDSQILHCLDCGAELDRKHNGAARAWQQAHADLDAYVRDYWASAAQQRQSAMEKTLVKKAKLAEGRRRARTLIDGEDGDGSRKVQSEQPRASG